MKTDTDALAAYFEAWQDGWPVPSGASINRVTHPSPELISVGWQDRVWSASECPDDCVQEMSEALTGVLVVELARRGLELSYYVCPEYGPSGADWRVADDNAVGGAEFDGPTPLCALVAAWMEANK